jgi:hypothetical protein
MMSNGPNTAMSSQDISQLLGLSGALSEEEVERKTKELCEIGKCTLVGVWGWQKRAESG